MRSHSVLIRNMRPILNYVLLNQYLSGGLPFCGPPLPFGPFSRRTSGYPARAPERFANWRAPGGLT